MFKKIRFNLDLLLEFLVVTLFITSLLPKNVSNKEISNIVNSKLNTNFSYNYEKVVENEETKEVLEEEIVEDEVIDEEVIVSEPVPEETKDKVSESAPVVNDPPVVTIPDYPVIDTYYGKLTGYGPNCRGCSGLTASGYDVSNTITYNDSEFGEIRIVAADKSIPFYSIIKISGMSGDPIYAIVLDRGGNVGFSKFSTFDLLFPTESSAAQEVGTISNVKFELIRKGA